MEQLIEKIEGKFEFEYLDGHLLINGDSEKVMELMDDKSVDLVLTDPPYGMSFQSNRRKTKHAKIENDDNLEWLEGFSNKLERIIKPNSHKYIFCSWHFIDKFKQAFKDIKNILVWMKNNIGMGDLYGDYAPQYENILFCSNGKLKLNNGRHSNILRYARTNNELHPTEKPVSIFAFLIQKSSNKGSIVFDGFSGSFTTTIACIRTNRKSICIELDKDYYMAGVKRVKEELRQGRLFN